MYIYVCTYYSSQPKKGQQSLLGAFAAKPSNSTTHIPISSHTSTSTTITKTNIATTNNKKRKANVNSFFQPISSPSPSSSRTSSPSPTPIDLTSELQHDNHSSNTNVDMNIPLHTIHEGQDNISLASIERPCTSPIDHNAILHNETTLNDVIDHSLIAPTDSSTHSNTDTISYKSSTSTSIVQASDTSSSSSSHKHGTQKLHNKRDPFASLIEQLNKRLAVIHY